MSFGESSGNLGSVDASWLANVVVHSTSPMRYSGDCCHKRMHRATTQHTCRLRPTDPPYYDNIGYADLSDFFYVWLRRALEAGLPGLFATITVPKAEELVATPYRHGGKEEAESFFLKGMTQAMQRLAEQAHPAFPVTIYYAFKQSETEEARHNQHWLGDIS